MGTWWILVVAIAVASSLAIAMLVCGSSIRRRGRTPSTDHDSRAYGFSRATEETHGTVVGGDSPTEHGMGRDAPHMPGVADPAANAGGHGRNGRPELQPKDRELRGRHLRGPGAPIDAGIERCISRQLVEDHRNQNLFCVVDDPIEVDRLCAEALEVMRNLDARFGRHLPSGHAADRMFHTDVKALIGSARTKGAIDFRVFRMIGVMRSIARSAAIDQDDLGRIMAVRTLLGTARLSDEEREQLSRGSDLFGKELEQAAFYVDHIDRALGEGRREQFGHGVAAEPMELRRSFH